MIELKNDTDCCGCTACEAICPQKAINMEEKPTLGFLYPKIDIHRCINCRLCEKVCQFKMPYSISGNNATPKVILARLKDSIQLQKSQSGGLFWAIAFKIIQANGIVYGASFNDTWHVYHQRIDNRVDLEKIRMSKYVQSDMRGVYSSVKKDLVSNKIVLFSGTPCQIRGLKSFVPISLHDNLFCIDIVCHCVPSPQIWEDYIEFLEKKRKKKIVEIRFRDKRIGWHGAKESFLYDDGTLEYRRTSNTLFFKLLSIRECCTICPYTNLERLGDITLGDFWGIPKKSKYEDNKGVSLVIVNSKKGASLINRIKDLCIMESGDNYNYIQPQLKAPVKMNPLRQKFLNDYTKKGFKYVAYKYSDCGWRYKKDLYISYIKKLFFFRWRLHY